MIFTILPYLFFNIFFIPYLHKKNVDPKFKNTDILKFDISKGEEIEEFIENATKQLGGGLDCLINNAGITQDNLAIRMNIDEWKKVIDINLTSTFLLSKFAIKKMLKNKYGKIIITKKKFQKH